MSTLKKQKMYALTFPLVTGILLLLICTCSGESDKRARKKLDVICNDDLAVLVDSIAVENLIEKPYYKLVFYHNYDEGKYSKKAVAEFYFLKKVPVKVVRKYRYLRSIRMWDRYSNEYMYIHDSTNVSPQ